MGEVDGSGLVAELARGSMTLERLARRHGMSIEELAAWAGRAETGRVLRGLLALGEARAALCAARARVDAARSLRELAKDRSNPETARKAALDLFNLELEVMEGEVGAVDEDEVRGMLEALGKDKAFGSWEEGTDCNQPVAPVNLGREG